METLSAVRTLPKRQAESLAMKMFVDSKPEEVEAAVNAWLKQNPAKVHHMGQSQSEKNGKFVFVITLLYSGLLD